MQGHMAVVNITGMGACVHGAGTQAMTRAQLSSLDTPPPSLYAQISGIPYRHNKDFDPKPRSYPEHMAEVLLRQAGAGGIGVPMLVGYS